MRRGRAVRMGIGLLAFGGAACAGERAPEPRPGAPAATVEGQVVRKGGGTLVLRAPGQREVELRVLDGVDVTVGEVHLSPGAIRPGAEVRASYEVVNGAPTAVAVHVLDEGGAWMSAGSDMHRGLSPDLGGSAPPHPAQDRLGGSDQGPAATSGGGEHSGGAAGGGIHGPNAVERPGPPPPDATWAPRDRR
ncbi:MAG TPA: hypothetical protein VD838_11305 [Anaeromyxobacteraceae bacterium]|nr:hypothetical protein [Anaeromyxobacteraceae bacterium]